MENEMAMKIKQTIDEFHQERIRGMYEQRIINY